MLRPKLFNDNRTLLADWEEVSFRVFKVAGVGAEFLEQTRQPYSPSSLYCFSDGLFITRKLNKGEKYEAVAMVRWYSHTTTKWTEVEMQVVPAKDEGDKKICNVKIIPANRKDIYDFRFEEVGMTESFCKTLRAAIETKKKQAQLPSSPPDTPKSPSAKGKPIFPSARSAQSYYQFNILESIPVSSGKAKGGFYTAYAIHVTRFDGKKFDVLKRYNQFYDLHSKLSKHYGRELDGVCKMPKKHLFNTDPVFIQKRCEKLTRFLNDMNQLTDVWSLPFVKRFFETGVEDDDDTEDTRSRLFRHFPIPSSPRDAKESSLKDQGRRDEEQIAEGAVRLVMPPLGTVKAISDYTATTERELSFKVGDVMTLLSQENENWWFARKDGTFGFIPSVDVTIVSSS